MPTDLIENYKAYLGLDKNDEAEIMRFHLAVEVMAPAIVAEFYDDLRELELFGLLVSSPEIESPDERHDGYVFMPTVFGEIWCRICR